MSEEKKTKKNNKIPDYIWRIYDDVADGYPRSECWRKYKECNYNNPSADEDSFNADYKQVISLYARDIEHLPMEERAKMYNRYLRVYRAVMDRGRFNDARQILDAMVRLTGSAAETGAPSMTLTPDGGGKVTVTFGLNANGEVGEDQ